MVTMQNESSHILMYEAPGGSLRIDVRFVDNSVWLSQNQIADLFQTTVQNVGKHIGNIYDEGELEPETTMAMIPLERLEGTRVVHRPVQHYNLDMIISVGYRVSSRVATRFRQWATERLVEYVVKGFTLDDERLKNPDGYGVDYFDDLTERIREIRASEKRFYQKVRDIFATSIDYDKNDDTARQFFQTVQNKLLYSVTGFTAAELINSRANRHKANMGLQSWAGSRVRRTDTTIGKNYLTQDEVDQLNRLVEQYLIFAEDRARRRIRTTMREWAERLDALLRLADREILDNLGTVSMEVAKLTASTEYDAYDTARRQREAITADEDDIASLVEYIDSLPDKDPS